MKKLVNHFFSEKGMTLIEILVSIVILSIIIMSFLTMFVQSSRTNNTSKNIMDATYVAETSMEEISNFVVSTNSLTFWSNLKISGYDKVAGTGTTFKKNSNTKGHYVTVDFTDKDTSKSMVKVIVKVFNNDTSSKKLEAQMEVLLSWKQ
ncbi:prepilin-type N-terminal cleavage/methylation domain-containing protein [Bacillus sp. S3]|uniref:prepilin-type N-terminal cleavage/methylation domain-containing protein n=1 Tax=Bacillus sp. S3 TaxID=486398 RepID=UPI00118BACDB|nr:prepilin-type N-terminal cleavage/methylation domain-containing protein [Bacillus sp. S3]QCJ43636.1 prepilin-type N-terminal cleavage/methylation domain-containing protein [Bacillus sp. S3]